MIFSLVAMTGLEKNVAEHLHICSGYVIQVSDPWPVGLLLLLFFCHFCIIKKNPETTTVEPVVAPLD